MNSKLRFVLFSTRIVVTFAALMGMRLATAQVDDWVAKNCPAMQQPAQKSLADLCNGHKACAMMVKLQDTCPKAQKFFTALDAAIGSAPSGLMGFLTRRTITPEAVWQASLPDFARDLEQRPEWKIKIDLVAKSLLAGSTEQFAGKNTAGREFILYGHEKDDGSSANRNGASIIFVATPIMQRSTYISGQRKQLDHVTLSGQRIVALAGSDGTTLEGLERATDGRVYAGTFIPNVDTWATGVLTMPDMSRYEGFFIDKQLRRGKFFRPDGTLSAEGFFDKDGLSIGKLYDATGVTIAEEIDKPKAQTLAAANARELAERQRREQEAARAAAEQQRVAEAARLEREFQISLTRMNAGQLFNKADELRTAGDTARAREVQRALISRFPDHPLAATAAQQMSGAGNPSPANSRPASSKSTSSTTGISCSDAISQLKKITETARVEGTPPTILTAKHWERAVWLNNYFIQAAARMPQCTNDAASLKNLEDALAFSKRVCTSNATGSTNCVSGVNYYIDMRQVDAVLQQLLAGSGASSAPIQTSGSTPTACAETPDATLARFNADLEQFIKINPTPGIAAGVGSGARAQYQWSLFIGTEGLRRLEPLRACLGPHYAANKQAFEGMRDNGKTGCEKLSTSPTSCTATYPKN